MADDKTSAEHDQTISSAPTPDPGSEAQLVASAARWMDDALIAWSEDKYGRVAVFAPLAVEHLGKAVLWKANPVLLVPLATNAESSLFSLATQPDLASPKLRTVGLTALFSRLERLLGGLPLDQTRRSRMADIRNGAMHVGSSAQFRHVLLDSLALCDVLLRYLGEDPRDFYGDHHADVRILLDEKRTEVSRRVAAKLARARRRLGELEELLGREVFKQSTDQLELAADQLNPDDFGIGLCAIEVECPECGSRGRLLGHLDVDAEIDYDYERLGGGEYESPPRSSRLVGHALSASLHLQRVPANPSRARGAERRTTAGLSPRDPRGGSRRGFRSGALHRIPVRTPGLGKTPKPLTTDRPAP